MPPRKEKTNSRPAPRRITPVMVVTRYDRISSFLITIVVGLTCCFLAAVAFWYSTRPPAPAQQLLPLELLRVTGGGIPDGEVGDSPNIESPLPENKDATAAEPQVESEQVAQRFASVVTFADQAAEVVPAAETSSNNPDAAPGGVAGSWKGTGRRPLGDGPGNGGGVAAELRWFIKFADDVNLAEYARQLDFFKIELGVVLPEGKIVYLTNLSNAAPTRRESTSGKGETRLYFTWVGGNRKQADLKLLEKVGISATGANILHFYPRDTEELLANLEFRFANRQPGEVRRTYFVVKPQDRGFTFLVTHQTYLR